MTLIRSTVSLGLIVGISLLVLDAFSWFVLPPVFTASFADYRRPAAAADRGFPRHYYEAHPLRGFDIAPNRAGRHYVHDSGSYPVWSNELGCFDEPVTPGSLDQGYVYLAGDSFTWGWTTFETHFGSALQEHLRQRTLKCGVPSTGQRHQFSKFLDVAKSAGQWPDVVIVSVVANDIGEDYAYPGNTVVDGWLATGREIAADDSLVDTPEDQIRQRISEYFDAPAPEGREALRTLVLRHSLSANILRGLKNLWFEDTPAEEKPAGDPARENYATRPFWSLAAPFDHYPSDVEKFATANLEALSQWRDHARTHGYTLLVSIVPYIRIGEGWPDYFAKFREQLETAGICVVDASKALEATGDAASHFWPVDGHFNPAGNRFYADFLVNVLTDPNLCSSGGGGCNGLPACST